MTRTSQSKSFKVFNRNFTIMVIGQIISLFGNAILRFALSIAVLDMTGSAAAFASISALSMIPTVLLSPLGGVLADRVSRKGIMTVLDFVTSAILAAFVLTFQSVPSVAIIAVMMVLLSIIQSFYQPSVQASIPTLVAGDGLMTANGVVAQVNALANLLGPILGGLLYGIFGLFPVLTVSVFCFFCSAVMECFLHIPFVKQEKRGGAVRTVVSDFSDSIRFLSKNNKGLMHLLLLVAGINLFLSAMIMVGLPYLVKIFLGLSSQMYGLAEGALGIGSILGGLLAGKVAKKLKFSSSHILLLISGAMALPLGMASLTNQWPWASFLVILISVAAMMCCATLFTVYAQTVLQRLTPPAMLGKVFSVVTVISMCAFPIGQGLYGVLFDWAKSYSFAVVLFAGSASVILAMLSRSVIKMIDNGSELQMEHDELEESKTLGIDF